MEYEKLLPDLEKENDRYVKDFKQQSITQNYSVKDIELNQLKVISITKIFCFYIFLLKENYISLVQKNSRIDEKNNELIKQLEILKVFNFNS